MGLNYTDGCVNFRDLGEYINLIVEDSELPPKRIYRGGSIDHVKNLEEMGSPKSVINLRNGIDYQAFDIDYYHFPMSNKIEKYDTTQKEVRRWLNDIIKTFESDTLKYPVLIHCLSGKDRTGIVIAALLLILGYSKEVIMEEYLLSEGEVKESLIRQSIEGVMPIEKYFDRVNLELIRQHLNS